MAELTEEEFYAMDDEAQEAAFRDAKAAMDEEVALDMDEVEEKYEPEAVYEEGEVDDVNEDEDSEESEDEENEEDIPEEDEEELEQPDEDSDKTEDTQEDGTEDEDETEDKDSASELDKDAEDNPEKEVEAKTEEPKISTYKVKANGTELELTNEELVKLAPKALDYTKKMQEIAPHRKNISIMVDNEITADDLNLLVDMKKGNVEAFSAMSKIAGVDTMEIDEEKAASYQPREYGRTEQQLKIDDVVSNISTDKEFEVTQSIVDRQWDAKSRDYFKGRPEDIQVLHDDIKSGRYGDISAKAMKLRVLDNGPAKSDVEYYIEAGHQYYAEQAKTAEAENVRAAEEAAKAEAEAKQKQEVEVAKANETKRVQTKKAAKTRKAAATTKKVAGKRNVIDYLDDNDEAYDEWYRKLQANM